MMQDKKKILITGGAKGIGFGIAETIAKEGAIAVIIGRKQVDNQKAIDRVKIYSYLLNLFEEKNKELINLLNTNLKEH